MMMRSLISKAIGWRVLYKQEYSSCLKEVVNAILRAGRQQWTDFDNIAATRRISAALPPESSPTTEMPFRLAVAERTPPVLHHAGMISSYQHQLLFLAGIM
jgi:hypothetical protein